METKPTPSSPGRKVLWSLWRIFLWLAISTIAAVVVLVAAGFGADAYDHWRSQKQKDKIAMDLGQIFEASTQVILYSLEPAQRLRSEANYPASSDTSTNGGRFHRWTILGEADVSREDRQTLLASLQTGIREARNMASCFEPRHGLRLVGSSGTVDLIICFSCMQIDPYGFNGDQTFAVSHLTQKTYDEMLAKYRLPKAKGPGSEDSKP